MDKIESIYKLLNEAEEAIDKDLEQNNNQNQQPSNEEQKTEQQTEQEPSEPNFENEEGEEGEEEADLLCEEVTIGKTTVYCSTLYSGEKSGPNEEPKDWHNVLIVSPDDTFSNFVEFDFWGDEECPNCEAYDEQHEEDEGGDNLFIDMAIFYNISLAYVACIIQKLSQEQQQELIEQSEDGEEISRSLKIAAPIVAKFKQLGINEEDIIQQYEAVENQQQ